MLAIELTAEIVAASAALLFWLGRMTKGRRTMAKEVVKDKIVEKPVYRCSEKCISDLAKDLFERFETSEWQYEDHDQLMEQSARQIELMQKCVEFAKQLHQPVPNQIQQPPPHGMTPAIRDLIAGLQFNQTMQQPK
jgi:hypothetical protein